MSDMVEKSTDVSEAVRQAASVATAAARRDDIPSIVCNIVDHSLLLAKLT